LGGGRGGEGNLREAKDRILRIFGDSTHTYLQGLELSINPKQNGRERERNKGEINRLKKSEGGRERERETEK
jgi:hypothetical protein